MVLFYSLLMGIDVGFTIIRNDGLFKYYLITFINKDNKQAYNDTIFNYSQNKIGGRVHEYNRSNTIKNLKTNKYNNLTTTKMDESVSISELYKLINLPKLNIYIDNDTIKNENTYKHYIESYYKFLLIPSNYEKNNKFLNFIFNIKYDTEYISKVVLTMYNNIEFGEYIDKEYSDELDKLNEEVSNFYNLSDMNDIIRNIVKHYERKDKEFAKYLKSIHCLLWIIDFYRNVEDDFGFNTCSKKEFESLLTPELEQKILDDIIKDNYENYKNKNDITDKLNTMINYIGETYNKSEAYTDLHDKSFYTQCWDFVDFAKIIEYIDIHNLDPFTVLKRLYADYSHAMYKLKEPEPGIQSSSGSVLEELGYASNKELKRTPEMQRMVDEIYDLKIEGFKSDFDKTSKTLINLFKKTVEKHLTWGLKIF
jgi:hypothetical protein